MAYAPTTWDANDVITKDKLNKIEQGINTASKLSGTDIDTDKDWNGKSITNVGTLQNQTGNLGARTGFVDVPGDVVRISIPLAVTLRSTESATLASFTVPPDYSGDVDSNLRIGITKTSENYLTNLTITVERNGTIIGTGDIAVFEQTYGNIDTTGGCKAGDVIVVKVTYGGDGWEGRPTVTITKLEVKSARKADVPAYKVFAETGAW